jgi:hypothetical protein
MTKLRRFLEPIQSPLLEDDGAAMQEDFQNGWSQNQKKSMGSNLFDPNLARKKKEDNNQKRERFSRRNNFRVVQFMVGIIISLTGWIQKCRSDGHLQSGLGFVIIAV